VTAWAGFYSRSLDRLDELVRRPNRDEPDPADPCGSLAEFAPIYAQAETLVAQAGAASVLDLGSCFGFFPLRLALAGPERAVSAADVSAGTCTLLRRVAGRLGVPLPVLHCDAAAVPLADGAVETVTLLHVLEHVDAEHGRRILTESLRLARRQVIVAVPLEPEATAAYGHVRTISLDDLCDDGITLRSGTEWHVDVFEHHGGWLVLTRF
jgi:SAM-dependent methyltransferase